MERMLTVVATCRQQGRNVLDYLTSCFEADRRGQALPSLLPVRRGRIQSRLIPPIPPCERLRDAKSLVYLLPQDCPSIEHGRSPSLCRRMDYAKPLPNCPFRRRRHAQYADSAGGRKDTALLNSRVRAAPSAAMGDICRIFRH